MTPLGPGYSEFSSSLFSGKGRFANRSAVGYCVTAVESKNSNSVSRTERLFQRLEKITRQLPSRATPEAVHQLRTTIRRIETLIHTHAVGKRRSMAKLSKQLAALRRRAGKVRDLDVQLVALRSVRLEGGVRDKAILSRYLSALRGKREKKLTRAVEDELGSGLRKRMERASKLLSEPAQAGLFQDFTAEALQRFQALAESYPPFTEENLHEFRMQCKRIRYLAEMSGDTPEAARVVGALKRVQDAIGEWHDWLTLTEVAREVIANPVSPLLAALRASCRSKFNEALRVVADARRQLLRKVAEPSAGATGRLRAEAASRKSARSAVEPAPASRAAAG